MSVPLLLSHWRTDPEIASNIDATQSIPFQPARYSPLPGALHPVLTNALERQGITALYTHQAAAWEHTQEGRNIVVVTGTASGKTLCYNLPVLDSLLRDPQARALYLFPTKALAQDQNDGLRDLVSTFASSAGNFQTLVSVYDGDTPSSARSGIRTTARLILSNPDMLHTGILPHHTAWAEFFRNLQTIVIDEMHIYRGVFGSHMANVLRRLKRVAHFYGSFPRFILTSATIANPRELAGRLIEEPITLIDDDGAARGSKTFLIYNPPIINKDLGLRKSALQESVRLAGDLLTYNLQTIIFARSRRSVEIILTYLRQIFPENAEAMRGYRSGYLSRQRREIERGLRQGEVRVVVATNALELGIDIGQMGASLLVGYPGTIAAAWQQAGRAGRGEMPSLAVLIATADPLDQFLAGHPGYFFERPVEQALINPDNLLILLGHLSCAAFELPFQAGDGFGKVEASRVQEFLEFLKEQGILHQSGTKYFWMADQYPAQSVSLRSASADSVLLQVEQNEMIAPTIIGQVDFASALWMVHPQAIYLHEGQTYYVETLDLEQKVAHLMPVETDYYTEPRTESTVQLLEKLDESEAPGGAKAYGEISVTTQVIGFRKVKWYTHEQLGLGEVTLPPTELQTTGYWLSLSEKTVVELQDMGLWTNSANDYGPDWPAQRDRARLRDGYRCQVCGVSEQGRAHDVHHKTPFRTFASSQTANQLGNLITLCPTCHRRAETVVRVCSGLAGLSFALGHLAPFYLMCDTRDLGVHSDPQSPLAGGSPAVVLYDQVPAGIGFSQRLFELHDELMVRLFELVSSCECMDGCPSCVGPGGENGQGGKRETLAILQSLTNARPLG
jgi:DEAD/DEAH box helicase domain-containing protein